MTAEHPFINTPSSGDQEPYYPPATAAAAAPGLPIDADLPRIGDTVEGYRIEELLHIGPMTAVYKGSAEITRTHATLLLCRPRSSAPLRRSFELSRNLQARIDNPAVARIAGGGTWRGDLPVTIRQFIPGKTIDAYLAVAGGFPAQVCRAIAGSVTAILAEIADLVEETHVAGYFHRCLWHIKPGDVVISPRGRLFLLSHGIDHHFDVRLYIRPADPTDRPPYSPAMDQTTVIHSVGALLKSMVDGADSLHGETPAAPRTDREAEALRAITLRCGVAGEGAKGAPFTSLFDLLETLRTPQGRRSGSAGSEEIIAVYFAGAEQGGKR
jgi:hypothetical protein